MNNMFFFKFNLRLVLRYDFSSPDLTCVTDHDIAWNR